jgi:hypothetical protein
MRALGVYDWPNVRILEGRWQDFLSPDKIGEVLEGTDDGAGVGYGAVFFDTFAEGYEGGSMLLASRSVHLTASGRLTLMLTDQI